MIRLFISTETDFTHNGVHILDDIAIGDSCGLSNGINQVYSLEMEVTIYNNSKWKDIEPDMLLKVPTEKGEQVFRIKEVVKGLNTLKIHGKQVFFDLEANFILDTNVVNKSGAEAISQITGAMINTTLNTYHGTSNISTVANARLVRKNVVSTLLGSDDNSFINRWGGELEVDNFNFALNTRIGSDRGFQIRYGKNCTGYEGTINTYGLCTRIVPVGFNGIMLDNPKWVNSPNITKYSQIYTQEVKYENIKVKEKDDDDGFDTIEEARAALIEAALDTFKNTKCDLPSFSAKVNFVTLKNTEEYKDVQGLERVELGDDVYIYLSNIGVTASARVVKTKYDFLNNRFTEIEIGDVKPNFFKQLITLKDNVDKLANDLGGNTWQDIISKSLDEATKLMEEGLRDSYVITMKNQIIIGDNPNINNMVNCIVLNKNGIGFSNNGYLPEQLVSAMTIDGKINASCITTGELNATLIKTGVISNINGTFEIDMLGSGIDFKSNGSRAISINGPQVEFFDWEGSERTTRVGNIYTSRSNGDASKPGISVAHREAATLALAYYDESTGKYLAYAHFDYNKILNQGKKEEITLYRSTRIDYLYTGDGHLTQRPDGRMEYATKDGFVFFVGAEQKFYYDKATDSIWSMSDLKTNKNLHSNGKLTIAAGFNLSYGGNSKFFYDASSDAIWAMSDFKVNTNFHVNGNLTVSGSKNCIQNTNNYGDRAFYATEDTESYLTDTCTQVMTVDTNNQRVILIDPVYKECVNTGIDYIVDIHKTSFGDYRILEQTMDYFILESDRPDFTFKYTIKAKRRGYENVRLEEYLGLEKYVSEEVK